MPLLGVSGVRLPMPRYLREPCFGLDGKTVAAYDAGAQTYFEKEQQLSDKLDRIFQQQILKNLRTFLQPGDSILDVGAGTGSAMIYFQQDGYDVYGVEPSKSFRNIAGNRRSWLPDRLVDGDFLHLGTPFLGNRFKAIYAANSLQHLERRDHPAAIAAMKNRLEPGGYVYLITAFDIPHTREATDSEALFDMSSASELIQHFEQQGFTHCWTERHQGETKTPGSNGERYHLLFQLF